MERKGSSSGLYISGSGARSRRSGTGTEESASGSGSGEGSSHGNAQFHDASATPSTMEEPQGGAGESSQERTQRGTVNIESFLVFRYLLYLASTQSSLADTCSATHS